MNVVDLARLQFGLTTIYHFLFVPMTMGLSLLIAIMQTLWWRTENPVYKHMTKFWGKLFIINFALGVVTGIVQEFQFGMNWSEYSRFMGDIFGAPLAIEALLAFYLESTFIGLWLFGWDRLPKTLHLASIWLVAIGANISALWILIANSFMQQPVGHDLITNEAGELVKVQMSDFWALITNSHVLVQFPHVFASAMTTAAFFVMGVSAWHLLRRTGYRDVFFRSTRLALIYGAVGISLVVLWGHSQAQHMVEVQPMKMAAAEGLFETEDPASFSLLTIGDLQQREEVFSIRIPRALTLLAYNRLDGEVKGINDLQAAYAAEYADRYGEDFDYRPPLAVIYWSFRAMVGAGTVMFALAFYGLYLLLRGRLDVTRWYLRLLLFAIALPIIANATGWIMTEMGRQPWIVFGLQTTQEAVSPNVTAAMVAFSVIFFTLIYASLIAIDVYLLAKFGKAGPAELEPQPEPVEPDTRSHPAQATA
jgi:cytochrome bd ubiquinol oxidase subunit I